MNNAIEDAIRMREQSYNTGYEDGWKDAAGGAEHFQHHVKNMRNDLSFALYEDGYRHGFIAYTTQRAATATPPDPSASYRRYLQHLQPSTPSTPSTATEQ